MIIMIIIDTIMMIIMIIKPGRDAVLLPSASPGLGARPRFASPATLGSA